MSWRFMQEICNLDSSVPHAVLIFATREYPEEKMRSICRHLLTHKCKCMYLVGKYAFGWYDVCNAINYEMLPDDVYSRIVLYGSPEEMTQSYSRLMERFQYAVAHVHGEPVEKLYLAYEAEDGIPELSDIDAFATDPNADISEEILRNWALGSVRQKVKAEMR